jgi:hypothetical protein
VSSPFDELPARDGYRAVVDAVRLLAGHQVIAFDEAWALCTGLDKTDMRPDEAARLRCLLHELGYEAQWVTEVGRTKFLRRWVRGPWPIDFNANLSRPITAFVAN